MPGEEGEQTKGPQPVRSLNKPKDISGYEWRVTRRHPDKHYPEIWTPFKKLDSQDPNIIPGIDEVPPTGLEGVKLSKEKPEVKKEPEPQKESRTNRYTDWINEH